MDCKQPDTSMGFSRHDYWSGLSVPSPGDLPNSRIESDSPALPVNSLPAEPPGKPFQVILTLISTLDLSQKVEK